MIGVFSKRNMAKCAIISLTMVCLMGMASVFVIGSTTVKVEADSLEDGFGEDAYSSEETDSVGGGSDEGISGYLKNHKAMTDEQLKKASDTLSPLTNFFGNIIGALLVVANTGIFVITAIDLVYIGVPPLRQYLYQANTDGTGSQTGGRMGGYGGGGYGGGMSQQGGMQKKKQWVSDEAVQCASLLGGSAVSAGNDAYGGANNQNMNENSKKSVIGAYLWKRAFFLVVFAVCTIILTSSLLVGTGVNVAGWLMNMLTTVNGYVPS